MSLRFPRCWRARWPCGAPPGSSRVSRFVRNVILVALLTLALDGSRAFATGDSDGPVAVLQTGSLPQKIAFLSSIEACTPLPPEYRATIRATALDEKQPDAVRILASVALCDVSDAYASILPVLARGSTEPTVSPSTHLAALTVMKHIAAAAIDAKATDLLPALEAAREQVTASKAAGTVEGAEIDAAIEKMDGSVRYLRTASEAKFGSLALKFVDEHAGAFAVGAAYLLLLIAIMALTIASPRHVVAMDETLQKLSFKLPDWLGGSSVSPRYLLLTNLLIRSGRVLDQWIAAQLPAARRHFERTPRFRGPAPAMSLKIDGKAADATPASMRGLLDSGTHRFMILGAPDLRVGLLGEIARWCLAGNLLPNVALPLCLDRDLLASCKDGNELLVKTSNLLKLSLETEPGAEFFSSLISRRRLVLIVPDLSGTDVRAVAELIAVTFPPEACLFLGADTAPQELLFSVAQIEVEAPPGRV